MLFLPTDLYRIYVSYWIWMKFSVRGFFGKRKPNLRSNFRNVNFWRWRNQYGGWNWDLSCLVYDLDAIWYSWVFQLRKPNFRSNCQYVHLKRKSLTFLKIGYQIRAYHMPNITNTKFHQNLTVNNVDLSFSRHIGSAILQNWRIENLTSNLVFSYQKTPGYQISYKSDDK